MKKLAFILAAVVLGGSVFAQAKDPVPFTDDKEVNLLALLPPPPAQDSAVTKTELDDLVGIQKSRTKARSELAVADDQENVWRFAGVFKNANFTAEKLPLFTAFFDRIVATESAVVDPAKDLWKRPRPYMADSRINPLLKKKTSGAYPSGHTTVGTLMGIVLSNMVPELRVPLMDRAAEFAHSRLVAGMHYASDIEAGKRAGTAIAAVIMLKPDFQQEFEAAKAELRSTLGYK